MFVRADSENLEHTQAVRSHSAGGRAFLPSLNEHFDTSSSSLRPPALNYFSGRGLRS